MATGFGRGGRGAAILQALSQPTRKPGESEEREDKGPNAAGAAPVQPAVAPIGRGSGVPLGRGSMMGLIQSARSLSITAQEAPASPSTTAAPSTGVEQPAPMLAPSSGLGRASVTSGTMMPMGRGLAAMQALLQSAGRALPLASRGAPLPGQGPGVAEATVSHTPPAVPSPVPLLHRGAETGRSRRSHLERMAYEDRGPPVHKVGTDGKPLVLSGNYIPIKCRNKGVYQYHVDFSPEIDSKSMRFKMMNEHRDVIGYTKAFDGSTLFLPIELPKNPTVLMSDRPTDGAKVTINIRIVKVLPPDSCEQLYNIIFRRIMSILEMVQVGRYYYNPKTPTSIPQHKLEVWPGYITAVQEHEGGLMLLADASHRVLRTESVLHIMHNIISRNPQGFSDEVTRTVVGTVILTKYNNKTYKVDDILWDKNPGHTFTSSSGEEMSFIDYYKKNYNIEINDENQPLLLHKPKRRLIPGVEKKSEVICLIPELSFMTGLTDALRADFRVMKDLGTHTRVTPEQRILVMGKFVNAVTSCPEAKAELDKWGLELDCDTIHIDGRQLPPEKIVFREHSITASPDADWGRDATRQAVITPVHLRNWVVLYTRRDQTKTEDYISQMMTVCPQMGIEVKTPQRFELRDDRTETFVRGLRDSIKPQVQIVVIVCPTSRDDRYNAIKKICCCECPIPSQVIIGKTISQANKLRSVTQKIALQINCKLGGELWALEIPLKNVMIVGIDVYHDAANKRGSVCGFIASTNRECTRWYSRVCIQPPGQELVDGLKVCLTASIRKYHEVNHALPQKIIVFRDGVGDGQLKTVANYEVEQLKTCFTNFGEDYDPTMAVVIVQKRINTRIFLKTSREMQNPPPGTVVDHTITRREWYDFFLVSQHVRQGTVSPTHYVVVYDNTGLQPNHIQRLSYKMTHLYYNWPGTVRVPAPCQYAHKLAQLVGQNIHKEPSQELSDRLFFL